VDNIKPFGVFIYFAILVGVMITVKADFMIYVAVVYAAVGGMAYGMYIGQSVEKNK
jgi:hypothetical protein